MGSDLDKNFGISQEWEFLVRGDLKGSPALRRQKFVWMASYKSAAPLLNESKTGALRNVQVAQLCIASFQK